LNAAGSQREGFAARDAKVWIGSNGTATSLHFDMAHAVIIQIFGRKRVTIFPPSQELSLLALLVQKYTY
jgi:hypothetical protein